jgi:hypothetical protein
MSGSFGAAASTAANRQTAATRRANPIHRAFTRRADRPFGLHRFIICRKQTLKKD